MSDPNAKVGPLTQADLQAIWVSAVDDSYSQPFIAAGEGRGFEAYTQAFAQFARVSNAIDITTQAMFVKPWSGQSNPSASGANLATVTLTFTRTGFLNVPTRLQAGQIFVAEVTTDWGDGGGVTVTTGRRFVLTQDVIFLPGESGPLTATANAEFPGYGYNNPQPNTLSAITQNGTQYSNVLATVVVVPGNVPPPPATNVQLIAFNQADMFLPDHVGQYIVFTAGANIGTVARAIAFIPPALPNGSAVLLEALCAVRVPSITGTFQVGEQVLIKNGSTVVGYGVFLVTRPDGNGNQRIGFVLTEGTLTLGNTINGVTSGATATTNLILYNPVFVSEAPSGGIGGASWRVADWVVDFGIVITHAAQPQGGTSPMLDELGSEKNIPRSPGESDTSYSYRQSKIADVVTPSAIKRTLNKTLGTIPWCFREVGQALLPGFYYDRYHDNNGDFYDDDCIVFTGTITSGVFPSPVNFQEPVMYLDTNGLIKATGYLGRIDSGTTFFMIRKSGVGSISHPAVFAAGDKILGLVSGAVFTIATVVSTPSVAASRYHTYFDYTDFRAMFVVNVPHSSLSEFGFFYDTYPLSHLGGGYDSNSSANPNFYDGFPIGQAGLMKQLWQNIDRIRAGGVTWYLKVDDGTCA